LQDLRFQENLKDALQMVLESNKILSQKNIKRGIKSHRETLHFAEWNERSL